MDQAYGNHARSPDLIDVLPLDAKRVIDIGCSTGDIAKEYHARGNPEHYLGIEIVPEDAEVARPYCSDLIVGNIEEFDTQRWKELHGYDLWVFGDVLEHLYDPWSVLKKVRHSLPPGGQIACCIPNAQHWSIQARLSIGDFRYEDKGLLDRTHIRFFTRQTIVEMLHGAGFEVIEIVPRYIQHPLAEHALGVIEHMAKLLGADPAVARADASVFQYIVRAK
jgi:2-polyprenyl-3-methyl-5-hydroxy-6-metoxy-1,4-benzoquinol methylase